ncbi:MAG: FecR family protein [Gemmatimonadales bacterium]
MKQESMPPPLPPEWPVLARYLAGESPPEEASQVRRWLAEDPSRAGALQELDQVTRAGLPAQRSVDVEAALRRVKTRFGEAEVIALPVRRRWPVTALAIAAGLALLVSGALLWRTLPWSRAAVPATTYATGIGRTDSVALPDGSTAVVGPHSRLTILAGYGAEGRGRTVELEGEAFFDVVHDVSRPFRVRAGRVVVQDLGTRFSVRSDAEGVRVVVESGSVRVEGNVRAAVRRIDLRAGQAITWRGNSVPPQLHLSTDQDLAWLKGQLSFDNASLLRVREDLRRWYGLELVLADSALASRHVTARFAGEPVEQVLRTLALSLGATVERRGDSAIVRPSAPPGRRP